MITAGMRRNRNSRQDVGAAWEKEGTSGRFLTLEMDARAVLADSLAALVRGEDRVAYLAFANDKKPGGREGQPDHRIIRPRQGAAEAEPIE